MRKPTRTREIGRGERVLPDAFTEASATWLLTKTRCWLTHLERRGLAESGGDTPERWSAAA